MKWEQLLSLKRQGDTQKRIRKEQDETRLGFEVDYDRIIFSSAFRSLQDKTQVIPLSKTSFVHTRLTHSLEVSVVGRSLGRLAGKQILEKHPQLSEIHGYQFNDFGAIVAAAALAHDIGNPPFGHSGEKAIGEYFKNGAGKKYKDQLTSEQYQDLISFEGNANGFKILTESREGIEGGLRLSYATLGAFTKYPKASLPYKPTHHIAHKKYGYFQSEEEQFTDVAQETGLLLHKIDNASTYSRHPLTFLVEAADDICYTIIDFEDGINLGLIDEEYALEYLIKLVKNSINTKKYGKLNTTADRLSYLRALAINTLIQEATDTFIKYEEEILSGTFATALLDKSEYQAQIEDILKTSIKEIYESPEVLEKEIAGYEILQTLLDCYCTAADNYTINECTNYDKLILKSEKDCFTYQSLDLYTRLISICKYVASLTDGNAVLKFQKIKGTSVAK
ncbi:dNTP triphosphohydrolase [Aquimarina sp. ERC-38]|uniref:dGTP triphosphohydrolase n=1 Tax=Aquimarina sp. ERC-38 TaxID=2949996 RepID=UPI002245DAF5|nr:dNTP triphosphohydrolase [Aquimarina sp. ERC-38]UZO82657.1 dNTP triphosphohydrolase [Aquimarina sp. ERC-38]